MSEAGDILRAMADIADRHPSLRAGQTIGNIVCWSGPTKHGDGDTPHRCPYHVSNEELAKLTETFKNTLAQPEDEDDCCDASTR